MPQLAGRARLMTLWAEWCIPCLLEARDLAAAQAIVDERGTEGLFRLYDAFNEDEVAGRSCAVTTDRIMRRAIRMSLADLEAAVTGG